MNKRCETFETKSVSDENLGAGLKDVEAAESAVDSDADEQYERCDGMEPATVIAHMIKNFEIIREQEVSRYRRRKLKHLADEDLQHVDDLTRQIITKILHNPITAMNEEKALLLSRNGGSNHRTEKVKIIEELFRVKS